MSVAVSAALRAGLRAHQAGELDRAIAVYDTVLERDAGNPTARHLRGFARLQLGHADKAMTDLRAAVRLAPGNAAAWTHFAVCLGASGASGRAAARRALALNPVTLEALDILANGEVESLVVRFTMLAPGDPVAWSRLAQCRAEPDPSAAARALRRVLCLTPADAASAIDLADVSRRRRDLVSARRHGDWAICLRPRDPRARAERAAAALEADDTALAFSDTAIALALAPEHAIAWSNRAEVHYRHADYPAATRCALRANAVTPTDDRITANLGAYRLAAGDLQAGWPLFRARPSRRSMRGPDLPRWRGESRARLLILAEQGLGDELIFSTLWSDLDAMVGAGELAHATVEVDRRLIPLARRALSNLEWTPRLADAWRVEDHSHWCLAGDLPERVRPALERFPGKGPGLMPAPDAVDRWRRWIAETAGGRRAIGVCWRSGSTAGHRGRHYPTVDDCAPLFALADLLFVVLQYDECQAELATVTPGQGSSVVVPPALDRRDDQDGVAALMAALDLVVSADTAVLALAGAIGAPAIGMSLHPGWVGLGQDHHPWFPGVTRTYRPPAVPWRTVIATEVAPTVAAQANGARRQ